GRVPARVEKPDRAGGDQDDEREGLMRRSGKFYGPMVELSRLQSELNRLFATFVETNQAGATATSWDPNVDVMDDGQKLRVLIEVPGVDPEDVRVMVRGRVL